MPDNMTENKAKEYLRGATLSRDDSLLKLRVTGSFLPGSAWLRDPRLGPLSRKRHVEQGASLFAKISPGSWHVAQSLTESFLRPSASTMEPACVDCGKLAISAKPSM